MAVTAKVDQLTLWIFTLKLTGQEVGASYVIVVVASLALISVCSVIIVVVLVFRQVSGLKIRMINNRPTATYKAP